MIDDSLCKAVKRSGLLIGVERRHLMSEDLD